MDTAEPGPSLESLMQLYQQADPAAVTALVRTLSPALYRFFASRTMSPAEAEDSLQDAWLRIHKARHTYRAGEPLLPWIYGIARYARVDAYRKRRRVMLHETAMDVLPERAVPENARAALPAWESLMAELPESQREVITLLKVGGLSLEEVARATSSTVGSVKQKAHRAYQRLRARLDPTGLAREGEEL